MRQLNGTINNNRRRIGTKDDGILHSISHFESMCIFISFTQNRKNKIEMSLHTAHTLHSALCSLVNGFRMPDAELMRYFAQMTRERDGKTTSILLAPIQIDDEKHIVCPLFPSISPAPRLASGERSSDLFSLLSC